MPIRIPNKEEEANTFYPRSLMNIRFLRLCGILLFTSPESICFDAIFSDRCIQYLKIFASGGARGRLSAPPDPPADLARALRALAGDA